MLNKFKKLAPVVMVGILAFGNSVFAATTETSTQLDSGSLDVTSLPATASFDTKTLTGTTDELTTTFTSPLTLKDARGTGAGWILQASAAQLTDNTADTLGKPLPFESLSLTLDQSNLTAAVNSGSSVENVAVNAGTHTLDNSDSSKVDLVEALPDYGMGTYDLNFNTDALKLSLNPGTTYKGTYTTTINWNLQASGPSL
ncbi:hypothetical protein GCM10008986_32680 [Salinibacillus aidingensis]|uniref:WxL domain-containing protein n=1 Tax=Salinibacillus aidingensis TaxID=237684 RepID=A0ABP3LNE1_9BACI